MHLLKLFAFNNSEEYAREVQMVLTRHFHAQLDAEADRLWDEGILNQEELDEIRKEDLHSKYSDYAADPDDDKFVDCAVAGNAKYIVTEDSHYDVLKGLDFPKVDIIKLDDIIQKL